MKAVTALWLPALVGVALVGCAGNPPPVETRAEEVARLQAHLVPVVDELDVRFYLDEGTSCNAILIPSGEFREGDASCGSATEGYGRFDARVRGSFERIRAAIEASEVGVHRFEASFTADGALRTAFFQRDDGSWKWNWAYLYDPDDAVAKNPETGGPTYARINGSWWLVTEVDD